MYYNLTYKNKDEKWVSRDFQKSENATKAAHEVLRTGETNSVMIERYEIKTED